jgi:Protein of unknown function (DUF3048) N-terminal domain/Protein of unknown function (DUF3048) C-terminal domain
MLRSEPPQTAANPTATLSPSPSPTETPSPSPSPTASPSPLATRCPLNGVPIAAAPPADRTALIVQIENHPLARPARNLTNADLVIEATVEGDVTRFSAIFYCQPTVGLTGPIRSARYYNVDLWQEMHGLTVAFGASGGARKRFVAAGMPQINGIFGGWPYFQRWGSAPAPHNLYGDIEAVRAAVVGNGTAAAQARLTGTLRRPFAIDPNPTFPVGTAVRTVTIRTNDYWVFGWTWDAGLHAWRRSDAGQADVDAANGKPITASSVVVQRITESVVYGDPDPGGNARRDLHLVGRGAGVLFVNGRAIPVRWSRSTASAATTWTYTDGRPMVLPPGQIWWELVPDFGSVTNA